MRKYTSSNFVLFQTILAILDPLLFYVNFRISLSVFAKKLCWDFDRYGFESIDQFWKNCHLSVDRVSRSM